MDRDETMSRLSAELNFNASRADHEPVTDSSLTYGDLRAFQAILGVSAHKLADMLRDSEPGYQPDDGSTEMEITVDDARRVGWALIGYAPDRDEILDRLRASITPAEARAVYPWRDIASDPPPVNESILVFIPNAEHYGAGIYRAMLVDMGTGRRWMTSALHMGRDTSPDSYPTHWLPLPTPPKA